MELYRDPASPYWYMDYVDPRTDKRVRKSTKRKLKAEAKQVADEVMKRLRDQVQLGVMEEMTLGEALARYLKAKEGKPDYKNARSSVRKLIGGMEDAEEDARTFHLSPALPLHDLTNKHLATLVEERLAEGRGPQIINHELHALRRTINLARDKWEVRVPARLKFEDLDTEDRTRVLSDEEEARLLEELDPEKVFYTKTGRAVPMDGEIKAWRQDAYDLTIFMLDTGARFSEIATLTWDCIDVIGWVWVNIYRSKVDNEGTLALTDRLRDMLQRRRAARKNSPYLFASRLDGGKHRSGTTGSIRSAIERAGLNADHLVKRFGRCDTRAFRHTFATRLVIAGVSLYKVQKLLGHASPDMTQRYANLRAGDAAHEAAAILNARQTNARAQQDADQQPADVASRSAA